METTARWIIERILHNINLDSFWTLGENQKWHYFSIECEERAEGIYIEIDAQIDIYSIVRFQVDLSVVVGIVVVAVVVAAIVVVFGSKFIVDHR